MEWERPAAKNVPPYLLEGEQAPGIVLPTDFCIQLLCAVVRKPGGERARW